MMSPAIPVDGINGPSAFLHNLRSIHIGINYDAHLLALPPLTSDIAINKYGVDEDSDFPLEGYNLPQLCIGLDYRSNPSRTFDMLLARLSWLCHAWFRNCSGFLKMLYDSGALLSGSAALKVLSGKCFDPSDIDLVVSALGEDAVEDFLLTKGYTLIHAWTTNADDYYVSGLPGLSIRRYSCGHHFVDVSTAPVGCLSVSSTLCHNMIFLVIEQSV